LGARAPAPGMLVAQGTSRVPLAPVVSSSERISCQFREAKRPHLYKGQHLLPSCVPGCDGPSSPLAQQMLLRGEWFNYPRPSCLAHEQTSWTATRAKASTLARAVMRLCNCYVRNEQLAGYYE
jgi:hypothetical protein